MTRVLFSLVGLVFLVAAVAKLSNPSSTLEILNVVGWGPVTRESALVVLLSIEFSVGGALVLTTRQKLAPIVGVCLLVVFSGFNVYLHSIDPNTVCSCFGDMLSQSMPQGLAASILRNAVLAAALVGGIAWQSWRPSHQATTGVARA